MSVPKIQHRPLFSSDKCSGTVSIVGPRAVAGAVGSVETPVFQGLGTSPADSTAQTLGCSDPQIPPKTPNSGGAESPGDRQRLRGDDQGAGARAPDCPGWRIPESAKTDRRARGDEAPAIDL